MSTVLPPTGQPRTDVAPPQTAAQSSAPTYFVWYLLGGLAFLAGVVGVFVLPMLAIAGPAVVACFGLGLILAAEAMKRADERHEESIYYARYLCDMQYRGQFRS